MRSFGYSVRRQFPNILVCCAINACAFCSRLLQRAGFVSAVRPPSDRFVTSENLEPRRAAIKSEEDREQPPSLLARVTALLERVSRFLGRAIPLLERVNFTANVCRRFLDRVNGSSSVQIASSFVGRKSHWSVIHSVTLFMFNKDEG